MDMIRAFPKDADPMAVLRTVTSALGMYDPAADENSEPELRRKAILLTAQLPTVTAAYARIRRGEEPVEPRTSWARRPTSSTCSTAKRPTRRASAPWTSRSCCTPSTG
jgi:citrate synthase